MATDRQLVKQAEVGLVSSRPLVNAILEVGRANSDFFSFAKASDDGMASTTTSETDCNIYVIRNGILRSISYVPTSGTITADPTNNAVVTVNKRDLNGANQTAVGTLTTNAAGIGTTLAQRGNAAFTLTSTAVAIAAGSTFTFSVAKGGTGVVLRAGFFILEVEWD